MMYCAKLILCYYERLNNKLPNAHMHCLAILVARAFADTPLVLETVDPACGTIYWVFVMSLFHGQFGLARFFWVVLLLKFLFFFNIFWVLNYAPCPFLLTLLYFLILGIFFHLLHEINTYLDPGFELAFKEHFSLNKHLLRLVKELLPLHHEQPLCLHLESLLTEKHFRNSDGHFTSAFCEIIKKFTRCFGLNLLNWHCSQFLLDQFVLSRCSSRNVLSANVFLALNFFVAVLIELKEAIFNTPNFDEFLGKINSRSPLFRG